MARCTLRCLLMLMLYVCFAAAAVQSVGGGRKTKMAASRIFRRTGGSHPRAGCAPGEVPCPDGACINKRWVCDGQVDCRGGSDELHCQSACGGDSDKFQCNNGRCVPVAYRCDGANDCTDGSDETKCSHLSTCKPGQFQCGPQCLPALWRCDGHVDCADSSDERHCAGETCAPAEFTCSNNHCVDATFVCDGDNDCGDLSDETGCSCSSAQFTCHHGGCVPLTYICDGDDDCGDFSDEHCPDIPPGRCEDKMSLADCRHMNTSTYPICLEESDAYKHCRKFCELCDTSGSGSTRDSTTARGTSPTTAASPFVTEDNIPTMEDTTPIFIG